MKTNQNLNLYESVNPSDSNKARITSIVFLILVLIILLFPFFSTVFPIPEAEGVAVSFGNVESAGGGDNPDPTPVNPNSTPTPPTEAETETETSDDPDSYKIPDKKDDKKKTDKNDTKKEDKKVDDNALFPGKKGIGDGDGPGKQGSPNGEGDNPLNKGTGKGDKGDGTGKIGNREPVSKCPQSRNFSEQGVAMVYICVDEQGKVVSAEFRRTSSYGNSTIKREDTKKLAIECARAYIYPPATSGVGTACGTIPINFKFQ
jgi:hypothetical protein